MPQSGQADHTKPPQWGFKKVCKCPTLGYQNSIFAFYFCRGPVRVNMTLKQQDKTMKGNDANETKGDVR